MAENNGPNRSPLRSILTFLVVIVVPLALGLYMAPKWKPEPKIGIVRLSFDIFGDSAFVITEQMAYAREHDDIDAVVLIINSPGGSAAYSEELYLDVLNTRTAGIPVIASIDLVAASGAYYMAAGANEIYAEPTSSVGSVGVIASLPGPVFIEEELLTTGPYKAFGGTRDGFVRQMERAKFAFLEAVRLGRGDNLKIDLDTLSRAEIFTGVEAKEYGLIDGLLSTDEAIERAAELAGLKNYEVVELFPIVFEDGNIFFFDYQPPAIDAEKLWAAPTDLPPGLYYRYIELPSNQ
jgi:protease-4